MANAIPIFLKILREQNRIRVALKIYPFRQPESQSILFQQPCRVNRKISQNAVCTCAFESD